jgi:hypothetical protein
MLMIKQLTNNYEELYKEYKDFLIKNNLTENDILQIHFVYLINTYNKNCLKSKPNLTKEECFMYNLTVSDDCEWINVDNNYGMIYAQLKNKKIIAFRSTETCLKPKQFRTLKQRIVNIDEKNEHLQLLKKENYF